MANVKFVALTVACVFVIACGSSGSQTAANSAEASGSEVAQNENGVAMKGGQPQQEEEADYEDSYADAE